MLRKNEKAKAPLAAGAQPANATAPAANPAGALASRYWEGPFSMALELDRYFDHLRRDMETLFFPSASALWPSAAADVASVRPARVDLLDKGTEYVLAAELPGFDKDHVTVEVTPEGIELQARREQEKSEGSESEGFLARERSSEALHRVIGFPEEVNPDQVAAELKNGVLTVRVAKAGPVDEKKTKVQVG